MNSPRDHHPDRLPGARLALAWLILGGLVVGLAGVTAHAYRTVKVRGEELTDALDDAITQRVVLAAQRGYIYDRNGRWLATSELVSSVFLDPKLLNRRRVKDVRDATSLLVELAGILRLDPVALGREVNERPDREFLWVKRHVSEPERRAVEELRERRRAPEIGLRKESRRSYPNGAVGAHVIGFVGAEGAQEGVEKAWDAWLAEEDGYTCVRCDSAGRPLRLLREDTRPPRNGRSLTLTIDLEIQQRAEAVLSEACKAHDAPSGSAIVVDCRTGELLALANFPTYDPNRPGDANAESRKNRAITDPYEPGSTFKVFVAAAALEAGVTRLGDRIDCEGGLFAYNGRRLHDHHSYGTLTFEEVIAKSSNIGMAKLGLRMGNDRLYEALTRFGFGRSTGLGLPGESRGLLYPPTRWSGTSVLSVSMGQELAVTPMQLAAAFATIAGGGKARRTKLVRTIETVTDHGAELDLDFRDPTVTADVLAPRIARTMIDPVMSAVVSEGTGTKAALTDWTLFGKTGTAQVSRPGGGYDPFLMVGSFIAGAPAKDPRVVVLVNLNRVSKRSGKGYYGGIVAAPAVKKIMEFVLPYLDAPLDPPPAKDPRSAGRAAHND